MDDKKDWQEWHSHYDNKDSELARRLILVQRAIHDCLSEKSDAKYQIIDICAGDGRDLLPVLAQFSDDENIYSYLVEIDEGLSAQARDTAKSDGLRGATVLTGDASRMSAYENTIPANLILLCGVFGNIAMEDVAKIIQSLPQLSKPGARVIWTRNLRDPEPAKAIRQMFRKNSFKEVRFDVTDGALYGVGVHEYSGEPTKFERDVKLFTFVR